MKARIILVLLAVCCCFMNAHASEITEAAMIDGIPDPFAGALSELSLNANGSFAYRLSLGDLERAFFLLSYEDHCRIAILNKQDGVWTAHTISNPLPLQSSGEPPAMYHAYSPNDFYLEYVDGLQSDHDALRRSASISFTFSLDYDDVWRLFDYDVASQNPATTFMHRFWIAMNNQMVVGIVERQLEKIDLNQIPLTIDEANDLLSLEGYAMICADDVEEIVPLYQEMDEESPVICYYAPGVMIEVLNQNAGGAWEKVNIDGLEGYMKDSHLAHGQTIREVEQSYTSRTLLSSADTDILEVKLEPSESSATSCWFPNGSDVNEIGRTQDGWSHIRFEYLSGFVRTSLLK